MKRLQTIGLLVAAGALLAVPAVGQADHGVPHGKAKGKAKREGKARGKSQSRCVVNKGFVVKGTLVAGGYNAGGPAAGDETVTLDVTKMNKHASRAGLTDAVAGGSLQYRVTNAGSDPFRLQISDEVPGTAPGAGDRVRISGKVAVTKRKCEPNASLEDRYGIVDVRKVKIVDAD